MLKWVHSMNVGRRISAWQFTVGFPVACGMHIGTPVRVRGVPVGQVVGVKPKLERVEATVEIREPGVVIPKNALIEANQTGLISETMIDVTPATPFPEYSAGPQDAECSEEGILVCNRDYIDGDQGYSLDQLVQVCTKLAGKMDSFALDQMLETATAVNDALLESKPLLDEATTLAQAVTPLLQELNQTDVMGSLEKLTTSAAVAVEDIVKINKTVLTAENLDLLRESVSTLVTTLRHIEQISDNVSGVVGDASTQANIKQLIQSLSRILVD